MNKLLLSLWSCHKVSHSAFVLRMGLLCGHSLERNLILDHRASLKLLQMSPQPSFHPGKNGLEWCETL